MDLKKNYDGTEVVVYIPTGIGNNKVLLKPENGETKGDTMFLYFATITANILMFVYGTCLTSPVIPQLKSDNPEVNPLGKGITTVEVSLLAGLPLFFAIFSTLCFGKLPDLIGRKNTILCMSMGTLLSNTAVAFGTHIYVYYIGRSITNLCLGLIFVMLPIYLNEICEDHNRAKHGCLMMFFIPLGSLYGYLVGPITTVRSFTLLSAAPLIIQLILLCSLVPESPFHTAFKGDKKATIDILRKLRNNKSAEEIERDYIQIDTILKFRNEAKVGGLKRIFDTKASRRGLIIGLGACLATYMSGVPVIMGFLGPIFNDAGTNLSGNAIAILVGSVKLVFFFVLITIVGKFGTRHILLFSSLGTAISLAVLTVYFYLIEIKSPIIDRIRWLPIVCVLVYIMIYSLGLGSIPFFVLSEMFPSDLRSTATSLVMLVINIFAFISTIAFPLLSEIGIHYSIGTFSVGCFLSFIFLYFFLPETKGKSFLEIQEILSE